MGLLCSQSPPMVPAFEGMLLALREASELLGAPRTLVEPYPWLFSYAPVSNWSVPLGEMTKT